MQQSSIKVRVGRFTWIVREDNPPCASLLKDPDGYLTRPELLIKDSNVVTIGRVLPDSPTDKALILRRLNYRNWRHRLRDLVRPSRARTAFIRGLALEAAGIPTPRALAVTERRRFRWPIRAYLVTEEVPGGMNIGWMIRRKRAALPDLTRNLAAALAKLHDAGFSHRDLKPSNILVHGQSEIAFIDLDAVRQYDRVRLPEHRAVLDLARLARGVSGFPGISALLLGRFLRHYCRLRSLDWRHWWCLLRSRLAVTSR